MRKLKKTVLDTEHPRKLKQRGKLDREILEWQTRQETIG
jgi:hypothetical protein